MVLDLLEKSKVNIKDLAISKSRTPSFVALDWEKEAPKDFLQGVFEDMDTYRQDRSPFSLSLAMHLARMVKILDPSIPSGNYFYESDWDRLKKIMEEDKQKGHWDGVADHAADIKVICPERYQDLGLTDADLENIRQKQSEIAAYHKRLNKNGSNFIVIARNVKMILPDFVNPIYQDSYMWQTLVETAELERKKHEWFSFAHWLADIRLALPERFKEFPLNLQVWEGIKAIIPTLTTPVDFLRIFTNQKILAAEKILITDKSLEIVMPKVRFDETGPKLPETRKF